MKWVIVKESFLSSDVIGKYVPRQLSNGQYLVRVTSSNSHLLRGLKRYDSEQLNMIDLDSQTLFQEKEDSIPGSQKLPFDSKVLPNGLKIYRRVHGYKKGVVVGSNEISIEVPYNAVKINSLEVINCSIEDSIDLIIKDSVNGDYTGVPNYTLNQFGFGVRMTNGYYKEESRYDADLFKYMNIVINYNSNTAKDIYFNIVFHEVK